MEPEEVAFALRRLWGTARSRLASSIALILDAANSKRSSSPSQFSASLASLIASAPLWLTSLVLATALYASKSFISSVALTRRRRKLSNRMLRRRRSGVGGNDPDAADDPAATKGGRAGRYGLLDDFDDNDNDRGSAGYEEDDYASDPDDSATTLASRARGEEEEAKAAPFFPNPKNVAGLLLRQPSVVSRGQQQQQQQQQVDVSASASHERPSSLHVARLEASPEFKSFLKARGLTPEHAAAARRRLGAYRELRAADPPSFRSLLLLSASSKKKQDGGGGGGARGVEEGVEAVPLSALELLADSAAGAGCGAFALLWWCRILLSWCLSSSTSPEGAPPLAFRGGVPAPLAASTALALAGLASAALLGRPLLLSLLFSSPLRSRYWWEDSRGGGAGTPSAGRRAALAFSLDAAAFGAATLGLGCVAGAAARCLAVGGERSSLGERSAGVRLVKERRYRALAAAAE